jgi:hypothetical protein
MRDKGHCMLNLDHFEDEYAHFLKHKAQFHTARAPLSQRIQTSIIRNHSPDNDQDSHIDNNHNKTETNTEFSLLTADLSLSMSNTPSISENTPSETNDSETFSLLDLDNTQSHKSNQEEDIKYDQDDWEDIQSDEEQKLEGQQQSFQIDQLSGISTPLCVDQFPIIMDNGELLLPSGKM